MTKEFFVPIKKYSKVFTSLSKKKLQQTHEADPNKNAMQYFNREIFS